MKTVSRMVRRYICAAFGIVLLVFSVNLALFLGVVIHFGTEQQDEGYFSISEFAASFTEVSDGVYQPDPGLDWQSYFEWAMLLDDGGAVIWSEALPEELDHAYTVPEVASFSRWYLRDYPVMVYRNGYGLLVAGLPVGSLTRFDFYMDNDILQVLLSGFVPLLLLDAGIVLLLCLLLGWRGAGPLREVARGIALLAEGKPVRLEAAGTTAELAEKLNQASVRLQQQTRVIEQRDMARTNWIAGVSHDIRTPLALIMGYAEQLEHMVLRDAEQRSKAAAIRFQSQKIKTLIEDLNLTSKLQYNAQPLRIREVAVGPLLRRCVAGFCNGAGDAHEVELSVSEAAERLTLRLDPELMTRAVDNLLNNSVRHNPDGCGVTVRAQVMDGSLVLEIRDTGAGYPAGVLHCLASPEAQNSSHAPHILGLYLVRQIVESHGGTVRFTNRGGACTTITLAIEETKQ